MKAEEITTDHYLMLTVGPKARKLLVAEAKRMGLSQFHYCEWAMRQPFGYLETLLREHRYELGGRRSSGGKK